MSRKLGQCPEWAHLYTFGGYLNIFACLSPMLACEQTDQCNFCLPCIDEQSQKRDGNINHPAWSLQTIFLHIRERGQLHSTFLPKAAFKKAPESMDRE